MQKISHLNNTLGKQCLIALSYFDAHGQPLKQSLLAGKVIAVDQEQGITLALFSGKQAITTTKDTNAKQHSALRTKTKKVTTMTIPADLSCWFTAPKGDYHTNQTALKITNPDFLVTWDIYQKNDDKKEGEQQWWQWLPRTATPLVN